MKNTYSVEEVRYLLTATLSSTLKNIVPNSIMIDDVTFEIVEEILNSKEVEAELQKLVP